MSPDLSTPRSPERWGVDRTSYPAKPAYVPVFASIRRTADARSLVTDAETGMYRREWRPGV